MIRFASRRPSAGSAVSSSSRFAAASEKEISSTLSDLLPSPRTAVSPSTALKIKERSPLPSLALLGMTPSSHQPITHRSESDDFPRPFSPKMAAQGLVRLPPSNHDSGSPQIGSPVRS